MASTAVPEGHLPLREAWELMLTCEERGELPADEGAPCWWVVLNAEEEQPPKLLCRSLAALLLELKQHRVATVRRLADERMIQQRWAQEKNEKRLELERRHPLARSDSASR